MKAEPGIRTEASIHDISTRMAMRGRGQSAIQPSDKTFNWSAVYNRATSKRNCKKDTAA